MTPRTFVILGATITGLGVVLGAFGAHSLAVSAERLEWWKTGVFYQLIHGLAFLAVGWIGTVWPKSWVRTTGICFLCGILLFSGSLYVMTLTGLTFLGIVTPIGGLLLIIGWACLAWSVARGTS